MNKTPIIHLDMSDPTFDRSLAGASVSWELTDEINHEALCMGLRAGGIQHLPEPCSPASALHRLMVQLYQDRHCLVKPVQNPVKGSKKPAYAVLPQKDEDGKLAFVQSWSVGLDTDEYGNTVLAFSDMAPEDSVEEINILYPAALENLGRTEQSIWLVSLVKGMLRGIPTIGGSGTFFIGPKEVKVWRELRTLLHPFGIRLYEIPAMRSAEALECVIESVKRYTEAAITELNEDLDKYAAMSQRVRNGEEGARNIQQRVLDARLAKITEQVQIVEKYESLFDTKLTELRSSLENLQAGFSGLVISTT